MNSVDQLRQRVLAARERLHRIPATGPGELGAPDPATGERWHRGNVLGHVAEMVPFWADQARAVMLGATAMGRDQPGTERRREGIERGAVMTENELRSQIEAGLDELDRLLLTVKVEDLERPVLYHRRDGDETSTLGGLVDQLLVGHLEGHLDQLESLT
jgi:hypothetical protein